MEGDIQNYSWRALFQREERLTPVLICKSCYENVTVVASIYSAGGDSICFMHLQRQDGRIFGRHMITQMRYRDRKCVGLRDNMWRDHWNERSPSQSRHGSTKGQSLHIKHVNPERWQRSISAFFTLYPKAKTLKNTGSIKKCWSKLCSVSRYPLT